MASANGRSYAAAGHLLEGMACPGGCIGGPGTLTALKQAGSAVQAFTGESIFKHAMDNPGTTDCLHD